MSPINYPGRLLLAQLPTPLEPLKSFLLPSEGAVWMKRDDLTGCATTGNKIRKLEFLLSDAKVSGCDAILTCGGLQSNHARSTAIAAASLGMKSFLFLRGPTADTPEGNYLLDQIVGATIVWMTPEEYRTGRDQRMQSFAESLREQGLTPYIIPEGGSNPIGAWGYIRATQELFDQVQLQRIQVDAIVCPVGSGGTYMGLLLGTRLLGWKISVIGINICDSAAFFQERIYREIHAAIERYSLPLTIDREEIDIRDGYVFGGYGEAPECIHGCIRDLASQTGLILEPVYTAKAFFGMMQEWKKGALGKEPRLVFIHTGGLFGLLCNRYAPFYG